MQQNKEKIKDDIIKVFGSIGSFVELKIIDYRRPMLNIPDLKSKLKKKILYNQYNFRNFDLFVISRFKKLVQDGTIIDKKQLLEEIKMEYFNNKE